MLDFARDSQYICNEEHGELAAEIEEVGRMLGAMIQSPEKFRL